MMKNILILILFSFLISCQSKEEVGHQRKVKKTYSPIELSSQKTPLGESKIIQVPLDLTEADYIGMIKEILQKHPKIANINLVASSKALQVIQKMEKGEEVSVAEKSLLEKEHILVYNRMGQSKEVWWLQQVGTVAQKQGHVTKL